MSHREDSHARVMSHLGRALSEAAGWCDWVRVDVEHRLGHVGDVGPVDDAEYGAALDAFGLIQEALDKVRRVGA
ncbi:hypothetical protein OG738_16670 [Amycolatopsis sp. NBC_01488]|uniref:hypothetical protein n=1 Tax=Amycolatopsis sp. NBC_01488 TaxID=2903563 RepID=UPI002E2BD0AE|nr:hypothetical protein [Amycolatopsis sp. NBC_01488]